MSETDVLVRKDGKAGRITLNRPDTLNALSYNMIKRIESALLEWEQAPDIDLIIIDAVGNKAFCAGGDISEMYNRGTKGDFDYGRSFWIDEYRLNTYIANYPKPYVAFMHGFVMGGGVGVSAHGSHRIVCEASKLAMPECSIGLIPDVGGTYILGRAPGHLGEFIGLTGYRMDPADALLAGFADMFVPQGSFDDVKIELTKSGDISVLEQYSESALPANLTTLSNEINAVFGQPSLVEINEALAANQSEWAARATKSIQHGSPLSLICTLKLIRGARKNKSLRDALDNEFRFTSRSAEMGDFLEGIRAAIIDKDRNPKWKYTSIEDVPLKLVEDMLAPL